MVSPFKPWLLAIPLVAAITGCGDESEPQLAAPATDPFRAPVVDIEAPEMLSTAQAIPAIVRAGHTGASAPVWEPGLTVSIVAKGGSATPSHGETDANGEVAFDLRAFPGQEEVVLLVNATDAEGYRAVETLAIPISGEGSLVVTELSMDGYVYAEDEENREPETFESYDLVEGRRRWDLLSEGTVDEMYALAELFVGTDLEVEERRVTFMWSANALIRTIVPPGVDDDIRADLGCDLDLEMDVIDSPALYTLTIEGEGHYEVEFAGEVFVCCHPENCDEEGQTCEPTQTFTGWLYPRSSGRFGSNYDIDVELDIDPDFEDGESVEITGGVTIWLEVIQ